MERQRRTTSGQWLLFVALLFGIATMHTVGHPAEHPPAGTTATVAHAAHVAHESPRPAPPATGPDDAGPAETGPADAAPMSGMDPDPMAVCLAVLSTWTVVLLALRLFGPRRARLFSDRATGVRPPLLPWPDPPPRRTVLATLSVLRI